MHSHLMQLQMTIATKLLRNHMVLVSLVGMGLLVVRLRLGMRLLLLNLMIAVL